MSTHANPPPPGGGDEPLVVNLQVVSPSVGVNSPLLFPDVPATTTMKQLKEKIRLAISFGPADDKQRLIHRGRALLRDTESLADIFGAETVSYSSNDWHTRPLVLMLTIAFFQQLRSPDRQTIHLVIREPIDNHSSNSTPAPTTTSTAAHGAVPGTGSPNPLLAGQQGSQMLFGPHATASFTRRTHSQPPGNDTHGSRNPSPAPAAAPLLQGDAAAAFHQHHQQMSQWLSQVQRDAMTRAIVGQNQRGRAQVGMRGIGDNQAFVPTTADGSHSGRASPAPSHTVFREMIGPNGHNYQVETVTRTASSGPQAGLSPTEVHNILRNADAHHATAAMASAMHRSASGASLHRSLHQPGVTTPIFNPNVPAVGSGPATPDVGHAAPSQAPNGPEVYILSSPEGPRALLLNSATSETFYSPRLRVNHVPHFGQILPYPNISYGAVQPQTPQEVRNRVQQVLVPGNLPNAPPEGQPQPLHPANPPAAGIPPLLMQIWPHIWLIFRLGVFVWLFTSPNASWSRWLTVVCLAVLVFVLSTGLLNSVAENAWRPVAQHLDNLLPTPERARAAPTGDGAVRPAEGNAEHPNPEGMAARLVAEHRERPNWVATQIRRFERAGLLFLASIAPGVAERHIANLEAEARAEETRRREAEAAAAAAAEEAESAAAAAKKEADDDTAAGQDGASKEGETKEMGSSGPSGTSQGEQPQTAVERQTTRPMEEGAEEVPIAL